jgi:hypothetical protein
MRILIGKYIFKGFGGRKPGYIPTPETKQKIRESINAPNARKANTSKNIGKCRGESFRMVFDEAHGILYCDLKIISGACGVMK